MTRVLAVALVLLLGRSGWSVAHAAPGDPVGPEFPVNTYTTGKQTDPAVAPDGAGGFIVVWEGASGATNASGDDITAQRFDAAGLPVGDAFHVNSYTTGDQFFSTVAPIGSGFVVLWESNGGSPGTDTSEDSVQGQRFDAAGTPVGGEFQVNTYTTSFQGFPMATALSDGFVVVWHSYGSSGTDTDGRSVQAQRFDATGSPAGGEFQVNTYTTGYQRYPAVVPLGTGGFVVVWSGNGSADSDTSASSIHAQRFDPMGTPVGGEMQVNSYTTSRQDFSTATADGSGGFVAVWHSDGSLGTDTSAGSIQARRFDEQGTPSGPEFQVNTYTTGIQFGYTAGPDGTGGFVVAWESPGSPGSDTSNDSIHARRFTAAWEPAGDQFQVNTFTTDDQKLPAVAPDGAGGFVVAWRSGGNVSSPDTNIRAQRFEGIPITTTTTLPPGEALEGRKLQLKSKPTRPERSALALLSKDPSLTLGRGNESPDDPVVQGGRLVLSSTGGGFAAEHDLSRSWRYLGKTGRNKGYKWKSRTAPIRSILVKPGKLAVVGQGAALGFDLDADPNPVRVELAIGAHAYCVEFGGDDRRFKAGRLYRAKRAAAPATCP